MFVERPGEQGGSEGRGAPLGRGRRHLEFYIHQLVERVLNPIVGIVGAPQLRLGNDMRSRPPGFAGSFGDQKSQGFAGCDGVRCTRTEPCFDELAGFDDSMTVTNRDRGSRFHSAADGKVVRHSMSLRSEEHTSELQSLIRNSYAVFCVKKKKYKKSNNNKNKNKRTKEQERVKIKEDNTRIKD